MPHDSVQTHHAMIDFDAAGLMNAFVQVLHGMIVNN